MFHRLNRTIADFSYGMRRTRAKLPASKNCPTAVPVKQIASSTGKWIALTFDDGPHPQNTPQVLALLRQYGVQATFCLVGTEVKKYPHLVRQIISKGHRLANHTMTHDMQILGKSNARRRWEVLAGLAAIQAAAPGAEVMYYRAPGGNIDDHMCRMVAQLGMQPLSWSIDTRDWSAPGVDYIIKAVQNNLAPGRVVLMHDGFDDRSQTIAALKRLLPNLIAQGYRFGFPDTKA